MCPRACFACDDDRPGLMPFFGRWACPLCMARIVARTEEMAMSRPRLRVAPRLSVVPSGEACGCGCGELEGGCAA